VTHGADLTSQTRETPGTGTEKAIFYVCAAMITVLVAIMALISPELAKEMDPAQAPFIGFIALYVGSGCFFLGAFWIVYKRTVCWPMWVIILPGLLMRLFMVPSTPIIEDDLYRYLWDGAVTASGINPYRHAPLDVMDEKGNYPEQLETLAGEPGSTIRKINHPQIRAVYPPVAQAVFALVHTVAPWSIVALRVTMLVFDVVAALLLLQLLRRLKLPMAFLIIYWWNPLVVKELINACHMDAIVLPFVVGALMLTIEQRPIKAVLLLTIAAGVKIWPLVFIPLVLRPFLAGPKRNLKTVFGAIVLVVVGVGTFFYPVYTGELGGSSGFTKYTLLWQNNDGLFRLVLALVAEIGTGFNVSMFMATQYTRIVIGGIYIVWLVALCVSPPRDTSHVIGKWLLAAAAIFLLSPTQFPWYFTWLLPLLVLKPSGALLAYVVMLPLYYLQYYLDVVGAGDQFYKTVVWLEHIPVWVLIAVEAVTARKKRMEYAR
jgi:alpha-1,6-mannosyltransferase